MTQPETQPTAETSLCDGVVTHLETAPAEASAEHHHDEAGHADQAHAMSPDGDRRYLWAALLV